MALILSLPPHLVGNPHDKGIMEAFYGISDKIGGGMYIADSAGPPSGWVEGSTPQLYRIKVNSHPTQQDKLQFTITATTAGTKLVKISNGSASYAQPSLESKPNGALISDLLKNSVDLAVDLAGIGLFSKLAKGTMAGLTAPVAVDVAKRVSMRFPPVAALATAGFVAKSAIDITKTILEVPEKPPTFSGSTDLILVTADFQDNVQFNLSEQDKKNTDLKDYKASSDHLKNNRDLVDRCSSEASEFVKNIIRDLIREESENPDFDFSKDPDDKDMFKKDIDEAIKPSVRDANDNKSDEVDVNFQVELINQMKKISLELTVMNQNKCKCVDYSDIFTLMIQKLNTIAEKENTTDYSVIFNSMIEKLNTIAEKDLNYDNLETLLNKYFKDSQNTNISDVLFNSFNFIQGDGFGFPDKSLIKILYHALFDTSQSFSGDQVFFPKNLHSMDSLVKLLNRYFTVRQTSNPDNTETIDFYMSDTESLDNVLKHKNLNETINNNVIIQGDGSFYDLDGEY